MLHGSGPISKQLELAKQELKNAENEKKKAFIREEDFKQALIQQLGLISS